MRDQNYRVRFARARENAKDYKNSIIQYIQSHYILSQITSTDKAFLAEKFKITPQTINQYLREIREVTDELVQLSQQYPINSKLLALGIQNAAALTFDEMRNLQIDSRPYSLDVPIGKFIWRLDFKLWGKEQKFVTLHFTECSSGKKYKLTAFVREGKPVIGKVELLQCNGSFFELEIFQNDKGYKNIKWIKRIT